MQVLCLSYAGTMYVSITIDESDCPEPERLGQLYLDELQQMAIELGVADAAESPPPPKGSSQCAAAAAPEGSATTASKSTQPQNKQSSATKAIGATALW